MRSIRLFLILASLVWLVAAAPVAAQPGDNPPIEFDSAIKWLKGQQQPDGGFLGFSGASDPGITADVVLGLAAAGVDLDQVSNGGPTVSEYLLASAGEYVNAPGGAAKLALAALAMGEDPRDFGGLDLIAAITAPLDRATGLYDSQLYNHAFAILALSAAGETIPDAALTALLDRQIDDGSWSFTGATDAGEGDSNTTSVVLQALTTFADRPTEAIEAGAGYLNAATADDGSVVYQVGAEDPPVGDANSTALAIQALIASSSTSDSASIESMRSALVAFQNPDSGAFIYRSDFPGDNLLATAQALPALAGKPLPIYRLNVEPVPELAAALAAASPGDPDLCVYSSATRHTLCHGFRAFWEANGGPDAFGGPVTEEFTDPASGSVVQYFQRARFEWLPGSNPNEFDVAVTLLDGTSD